MSVWTKTEPSPTPTGPWFKAFAKKLKAWWEGLFVGTGNSAGGETSGEPAGTPLTLNVSADEGEKAVVPADSLQEYDPLADWMALVAEGAPELLIPPEQGGIPWQTVSEASAEIGENREDTTDPSTLFANRAPTEPPAQQWRLPHKARPAIRNTASESRPPLPIAKADSGNMPVPSGDKVFSGLEPPGGSFSTSDAMMRRLPEQDDLTDAGRSRLAHEGNTRRVEDGMNVLRRSEGSFGSDQTLRPVAPDATRNGATESRTSQPRSNTAATPGSSNGVDGGSRGSSRVLPIFPALPTPGKIRYRESDIVAGQNDKRTPILPMRPRPDSERALRPMSAPMSQQEGSPAFRARSVSVGEESRPARSKWAEGLDLWPELPEDQPVSESNWMESYRSQEHLQALDIEQRGGN